MAFNKNNRNKPDQGDQGLQVTVYNNNVDQALRKLKKKMANDGILQLLRERRHFVSKTEKRLLAEARAKQRFAKEQRKRDNY